MNIYRQLSQNQLKLKSFCLALEILVMLPWPFSFMETLGVPLIFFYIISSLFWSKSGGTPIGSNES